MSADGMLFDVPAPIGSTRRQRPGWVRLRGGCGGVWRHRSGWLVHHCGHPTANWPYYAVNPARPDVLFMSGGYGPGRGFRTLADAQAAVEWQVHRESG